MIERYTRSNIIKITMTVVTMIVNVAFSPVQYRIRYHRRRTGDIGLDPIRRRRSLHDLPNSIDGFVRQGLALVTGETQLNIGGLAVGALRAGRR